jgi:hypothetical protein
MPVSVYGQASVGETSSGPKDASKATEDPIVILELGAATSWNVNGGAATFAPNLAAEITPIENWLELEAGVSRFHIHNSTEWVHFKENRKTDNSIAGEAAGDFMFWLARRHRFGWYLEPAYDYGFARGHQQSIGISGGLLIGIP